MEKVTELTTAVCADDGENPGPSPDRETSDGAETLGVAECSGDAVGDSERAESSSHDPQRAESSSHDPQRAESPSRGAERAESPSRGAERAESPSRGAERAECPSSGAERTDSPSRGAQPTESSHPDAQQTESSSRTAQQTESSSSGAQQTESPSSGAQQTESPSSGAQQTESPSSGAQQTESPSSGTQQTESPSSGAQRTESSSLVGQVTDSSSSDAPHTETPFSGAQQTESSSIDAQQTKSPSLGAQQTESSSRGAQNLDVGVENPEGAAKPVEFPLDAAILDGLASTVFLNDDFERERSVNPLASGDDPDTGADSPDRDVCSAVALSVVRVFRTGLPSFGLCPFHASIVERTSATVDDLSSVDNLSAPSNIDVFRRYYAARVPESDRGASSRPSDVFGGTSDVFWQPGRRSGSAEPMPSTSRGPMPSTSRGPMPSTSRGPSRRLDEPAVVTVPPTRSSTLYRRDVDPPTPLETPTSERAPRPSLFRRILQRCCCGMGMKLRCFDGDSGTSSYFLLENLGTDKDASTEKQEELHFFDDSGSYVSVVVEKNLRAIDLTQLLAVKNRVRKDYCWSIVEYWVEIGVERVLEDHEDVLSVHRQTESGAKKYIFRRFPNKYDFFSKPEDYFPPDMIDLKTYEPGFMYPEKHPEQLERVLTTAEELPVIFSQVNLRQECNRNIWIKTFLLLKDSKILMSSKVQVVAKFLRAWRETSTGYRPLEGETSIDHDDGLEQYVAIGEGNEEELEVLADLKDYEVYTSLNAKNQLKGPTEFGVVLRKTNEEDFADPVVLSFDKGKDRVCWVTAMRLAKYGKQLRENYKAFKNKQETISNNGSSGNINESVRSRVAMDFTGKVGRIVDDPMEAKAIAVSEGNAWKKRLRAKAESSRCGGLTLESGEEVKPHHGQPWYHKNMSREHALALISAHGKHDGVFVVRGSRSQPGGNVLSLKSQEKILHYPIKMVEDPEEKIMCYTIDGGATIFFDICQLVEFYRLNAGPLPTRLTNHLEKLPQPKTPVTTGASTDAQ